jgi:hypothetical protein
LKIPKTTEYEAEYMNDVDRKVLHKAIDELQIVIGSSYCDLLEDAPQNGWKTYLPGNTYYMIVLKKPNGDYSRRLIHDAMRNMKRDIKRLFKR